MMLELRPNCECCDRDLLPDSREARICTYECTFLLGLRRNSVEGRVPELRREFFAAAHSARSHAGETSSVDEAGRQRRWLPEAGVLAI